MLAPNEKWIDKDKPKNSTNVRAQYPGDIQPKLDGARCLAYWDGDRVVLMTRGRKEWTMPHIQEQLAKILPKDAMWDGELYCHGFKRQTIQKWLSNNYPESKKIMYCVYDVPIRDGEHKIWAERKVDLDEMVPGKAMQPDLAYPNIMKVLTLEVQDEDQVNACDEKFVEAGFEGSMFRNRKGPYEWGKRSKNLLKIKRFDDAEFEIVGWLEAEGGHAGCVIWLCSTVKGAPIVGYVEAKPKSTTLFKVVPNGSLPDRREWLRDAESFMRKELTVKYQGFSHDGLPQIAKGIAIRLPEDKSAPKAKKAKKGA
jgi:ATP-dependent DNA ligase